MYSYPRDNPGISLDEGYLPWGSDFQMLCYGHGDPTLAAATEVTARGAVGLAGAVTARVAVAAAATAAAAAAAAVGGLEIKSRVP